MLDVLKAPIIHRYQRLDTGLAGLWLCARRPPWNTEGETPFRPEAPPETMPTALEGSRDWRVASISP
jgi:hypothetical protein